GDTSTLPLPVPEKGSPSTPSLVPSGEPLSLPSGAPGLGGTRVVLLVGAGAGVGTVSGVVLGCTGVSWWGGSGGVWGTGGGASLPFLMRATGSSGSDASILYTSLEGGAGSWSTCQVPAKVKAASATRWRATAVGSDSQRRRAGFFLSSDIREL